MTVFGNREGEGAPLEKYKYKWSVPIKNVEVVESSVSSAYQVKIGHGKTTVQALKQGELNFLCDVTVKSYEESLDRVLYKIFPYFTIIT